MIQYENVFVIDHVTKEIKKDKQGNDKEITKKQKKVIARLFDTETKKSEFRDVTLQSIPDMFTYNPINPLQNSKYKSYLDNTRNLEKHTFKTLKEYNEFVKTIKKKTGEIIAVEYEGEEIYIEETVFEDDVFGYQNLAHQYIQRAFPNPMESNHVHRTWMLDIETRSDHAVDHFPHAFMAPEEVTMIQIHDNFTNQYIVMGRKEFTGKFDDNLNVKYIHIEQEADLLKLFLKLLNMHNPSIISGWNSMSFDTPYLTNRIAIVLDGYDGTNFREDLNHKNSYQDMKYVSQLSPMGIVQGVPEKRTFDGMDGVSVFWRGILLLDYRQLALKYGFLGLASYSLKNIAKKFNLSQKIDTSSYKNFDGTYTGNKYIFPDEEPKPGEDIVFDAQKAYRDNPTLDNKKSLEQIVFNRFVDYSLRDVEILVELDEKAGYLSSHRAIAYTSSVSMSDNWGTLGFWQSLMYKTAFDNGLVLPMKQQHDDPYNIWLAGWVRTQPGKYDYITSFDFTSLYPSLIRAFNIGGDTLIKEYQLPQELKDLRQKYFMFFSEDNLNRTEYPDKKVTLVEDGFDDETEKPKYKKVEVQGELHPLGSLVKKYNGDINDMVEETGYYYNILQNEEEIKNVLQKYDVSATPNGYFYTNTYQSALAYQMESIFNERVKEKRLGQKLSGVVNDIKEEITRRGL